VSARDEAIEQILPDYRRWLYFTANECAGSRPEIVDDLAQEGYIAMWRALPKYDPKQGHLPSYLTYCARSRMIEVLRRGTWTGKPENRGARSVEEVAHIDEWDGRDDLNVLLGGVDALNGVEIAYHDGEIAAALDTLSPAQRRYVIARFWLGLDPASREPGMRAMCALVPEMSQPWLWTGGRPPGSGAKRECAHDGGESFIDGVGKARCRACEREKARARYHGESGPRTREVGARERLAEALAHLAPAA
jgi:RNA polymerase sigma factor (sigma-70 family)